MFNPNILPKSIKVRFSFGENKKLLINIPEFDIFTEADNAFEIGEMLNDLIYTYFEVPENLRRFIRYVPKEAEEPDNFKELLMYKMFIDPESPPSVTKRK